MPSSAAVNNDGKSDRLFSIPGQDQLANLGFMDENQLKDAIQHPGSAIGPTTNRGRPFSLSGVQRVPDTPVQQQGTRNDHTNDGSSGNASGIGNDHVSSPLPPPTSESRLPIKPDDSDWATVETDTGDDSSGAGQSYQRHELPPGADTPKLYSHSPGQQSAKSAQEGTSTTISKNDPLPRPRTPSYDFGPHIMTNPLPPPNPKYLQSIYRPVRLTSYLLPLELFLVMQISYNLLTDHCHRATPNLNQRRRIGVRKVITHVMGSTRMPK